MSIDQGKLPAVRIGHRVRVRREDFDLFTARRSPAPAAQPSASTPEPTAELWAGFQGAMGEALDVAREGDRRALAEALRALAESAERLAAAIDPDA